MKKICICGGTLVLAVSLAGCNETMGGATAGPVVAAPVAVTATLPPGAACTRDIEGFETVLKADLATGNVEQKVYDRIQIELKEAASVCAGGKDQRARALVASSKARHGYRA